jgi:hypothetical protein
MSDMNKFILLAILMLFSSSIFSIERLDQMRFTNRARCALDSKHPTESTYLLVSNMDVARSIYRLAKSREENTTLLTRQGIDVYRYSILELLDLIHKKIIENKLPLLPSDTTVEGIPIFIVILWGNVLVTLYVPSLMNILRKFGQFQIKIIQDQSY